MLFDRDRLYPYPWYFADECLTKDIADIFGKKLDKIILELKDGHMKYYGDVDKFNEIGEFLLQKVKDDKQFYNLVEKNILETGNNLIKFCDDLKNLNLKKLSNEELLNLYTEYAKKLKLVRAWGWVPPLMDGVEVYFLSDYIQETFTEFLKNSEFKSKSAEFYSILSSSEKKSEVQTEEIERLKLAQEIEKTSAKLSELLREDSSEFSKEIERSYPEILEKIDLHAKKFEWLPYAYIGPGMNQKDVINLLHDSLNQKETIEKQINNIISHYEELPKQKKEITEKIKLSDELKYLFDVSAFFMHLKDLRKGIYQKSYVAMDPTIEEISNRINLSLEETKYLISNEIAEALLQNKDFSEIAAKRTKYCVMVVENGVTSVFIEEKAKQIIEKEISEEVIKTDVDEIKGMTAYSGQVEGIVKIVAVVADISKIKEGEILVSPATNPDLVVAMKKAAAFVTDMGGITSHAAIVSREMKKPCIVGTKIATKVLHDGDIVNVDANTGIVKIIERKK